jgi:flagellar motor switch protein FliN
MVMASAGRGIIEELCRSLQATANHPVKPGSPDVATIAAADISSRLGGAGAAFCLELGGLCKGRAAVLLSSIACAGLVGLLKGLSGKDLATRAGEPLVEQDIEELGLALSGALAGMADKLAAAIGETPGLGLGDAILVPQDGPGDLPQLLGPGPYPSAAFDISIETVTTGKGLILFPSSFAGVRASGTEQEEAGMPQNSSPGPTSTTGVLGELHPNIKRILRLRLPVSVTVAEKNMPLETVLKLSPGTIIEFNKGADENLDLLVNDRKIGAGEVVIIGERFGIQIKSVEGQRLRLQKMGMLGG